MSMDFFYANNYKMAMAGTEAVLEFFTLLPEFGETDDITGVGQVGEKMRVIVPIELLVSLGSAVMDSVKESEEDAGEK